MKREYLIGIVAVVAIVLVIIAARYYKNEEFVSSTSSTNDTNEKNENQIVENFPTAPQNVLVSDASGNLSVTNDLGLQHLAVAGNLNVTGAVRLSGDVMAANRNILAELDALKASIAAVNTRVDASNTSIVAANTSITATNARIDTVNNTAVFYDTAVKTLADNGIMNGGAYGAAGNFMAFGNCDQCAGGSDKFKLWPNPTATTSFKFVKKYP